MGTYVEEKLAMKMFVYLIENQKKNFNLFGELVV